MNILGLSAFYHEASACLLRDGGIVAALSEERLSREKHDPGFPLKSIRECLRIAGIGVHDIDHVAWYENPQMKRERQLSHASEDLWLSSPPELPEHSIRYALGYDGEIDFFPHHLSHAASAYYCSGYRDAAVMVVDGVGEWATTSLGTASPEGIEFLDEVLFPHSIGLLYSTVTSFLGFKVNNGEYKVMGLAPYGQPRFAEQFRTLLKNSEGADFTLDLKYFNFSGKGKMFTKEFSELFSLPPRQANDTLEQMHKDIARSLQLVLEETLLQKTNYLYAKTNTKNLCFAGGVALNCVANGRILREGPFESLFVQPAAGDAGGALGAALLAAAKHTSGAYTANPINNVYWGPSYSNCTIKKSLKGMGIKHEDYTGETESILSQLVEALVAGKVLGLLSGRMEFGPRALGARSILADPRHPDMRNIINRLVKKREGFRPFAPAIMEAYASHYFDIDHASPFMLETCSVKSGHELPAITHVDNSARPQTVPPGEDTLLPALLEAFYAATECPLLLNTSFNVRGEPIVCSPEDAVRSFIYSDLDILVLEHQLIRKDGIPEGLKNLITAQPMTQSRITSDAYTFI
ncbi:MAG: carbamoyltransferase [Myxococcales bacterium]|nr:carbamoyltransferase [Myxococcales bacterium]